MVAQNQDNNDTLRLLSRCLGISGIAIKISSYLEDDGHGQSRLCQMLLFGFRAKYRSSFSFFRQRVGPVNSQEAIKLVKAGKGPQEFCESGNEI